MQARTTSTAMRPSLAVALLSACSLFSGGDSNPPDTPEKPDGGGGPVDAGLPDALRPDAFVPSLGWVTGVVWAPGNAPGSVPAGHEIPIPGALVYVGNPDPIPDHVYCDRCETLPAGVVTSDIKGNFKLGPLLKGTHNLVIEKGQFRLEQQVVVEPDTTLELPAAMTALPSEHNPAAGKWIPRIALADGLWDDMEDILGKMGIGAVDANGTFVGTSAEGKFDLYINGNGQHGVFAIHDLSWLVTQPEEMMKYHIIMVPCSDGNNAELFGDAQVRQNLRDYVSMGGKLYVTDWSAEWEDVVFPEFIRFGDDHDTPAGALPEDFSQGDGSPGYGSSARADDADLAVWLDGQVGPLVDFYVTYHSGVIDAKSFAVEGNWNRIEATPSVVIGQDEGADVTETAKAWVKGGWGLEDGPNHPLTVTFEPLGCGRVLYSTYHTAENAHQGLVPQERVLLYLLMEIGVCKSGPIVVD